MSPVRKEGDFRSRHISSWKEFSMDQIEGGIRRGEFDDLPDQGKPIKIWQTAGNQEYDLAFSRLKNAGVLPAWMELDKEVGTMTERLWASLDRTEAELRQRIRELRQPATVSPAPEPSGILHKARSWFRQDCSDDAPPPVSMTTIMAERDHDRARFLDDAAALDRKIENYHNSLPQGAEHLQRLRWTPARARNIFDERIALASWFAEVETVSAQ